MATTDGNASSVKSVAGPCNMAAIKATIPCEPVAQDGKQKAERPGFLKRLRSRCKVFPFKREQENQGESQTQVIETMTAEEQPEHRDSVTSSFVEVTEMPPPLDGEDLLESLTPFDSDDLLSSLEGLDGEYNLEPGSVATVQEEEQIPRSAVTAEPAVIEDDAESDVGVELRFAAEQGILQLWALDDRRRRAETERRRRAHIRKQAEIRRRREEEQRRIEMEHRRAAEETQRREMRRMEMQRRHDMDQRRHAAEMRRLYQQQRAWEEDVTRREQDWGRRDHGRTHRNRVIGATLGNGLGGFGGSRYPGPDGVVTTPVAFPAMSPLGKTSNGCI